MLLNQLTAIVAIVGGVIAITLAITLALLPRWANAPHSPGAWWRFKKTVKLFLTM